ncbi:MAG: hypothetical protein GX941_10235 [Candidatus Methanofastidiosa archaeon]|nr:hypothetical protein [Candidatus Methanofastidiosa archaeon]
MLKSREHISGTYKVKLFKGNIEIIKRELTSSLFIPKIRSIRGVLIRKFLRMLQKL